MAENPSLIPADLIAEAGADLTQKLTAAARAAVEEALAAGAAATVAEVVVALESLTESLPPLLVAEIEATLPLIAAAAIERAQVEIAPAREETGQGFPPVPPEPAGDYSGWAASASAALIAAARDAAEAADTAEAARAAVLEAAADPAPFTVMAETAAARTVNDARLNTFRSNNDIVKKLEYVAVRDNKTSEVCQYLDNASFSVFAKNIPRPPVHNGCRSYLLPVTNIRRKAGATDKEIERQNWAIFRRLEREAKTKEAEGRSAPVLEFRLSPGGAGEFEGYASVWDVMDNHRTAFAPGSLSLPDAGLPLLFNHDPMRPLGRVIEARADARGLYVIGKLTLETAAGAEAFALIRDKAITGLSIGFKRLKDEAASGGRRILAAALKEVSLVPLPSNEAARITEVRSAPDNSPAAGAAPPKEEMKMSETTAPAGAEETRAAVDLLSKRLDKIEARSARLPLSPEAGEDGLEKRAFAAFIKTGKEAMQAEEVRALRASDSAAGGVTVPPGFAAELLRKLVENSPIRSLATVTTISTGELVLPKVTANPTAAWVAETAARPSTEPAFAQVQIPAHEAGCYVDISQRLLEDNAVNLESELSDMLAKEFARLEGLAFLKGDGTGKPKGIVGHADFTTLANGHATNLSADALVALMHTLPSTYRNAGVWLMNALTAGKVRQLKDADGNYLWRPSLAEGNPPTLLGRPIYETPDLDDVAATKIPLLFGDIKTAYRIADRVGVSLLRDPYSVATTGLVRFHSRVRVGGDLVMGAAVKGLVMAV